MVLALDYFRERVLRAGRWDAGRGASLGTFFIGQCLYRFANVYNKALRAEINGEEHREIPADEMAEEWFDPIRGIEAEVVARQDVADALAQVSTERAREALVLKHIGGYSYDEIAERLRYDRRPPNQQHARLPTRTCGGRTALRHSRSVVSISRRQAKGGDAYER